MRFIFYGIAVLFFLCGALLLGLAEKLGVILSLPFDNRLLLIVLCFGFGTVALTGTRR